jgi:hypothetical protein
MTRERSRLASIVSHRKGENYPFRSDAKAADLKIEPRKRMGIPVLLSCESLCVQAKRQS